VYPLLLRKFLMPSYEAIKKRNLLKYIDEYESHLSWSSEKLKQHQWNELTKLIDHAYNSTLYYKRVWTNAGINDPRDVTSMSDFEKLPTLTKSDVNLYYNEFKSNTVPCTIKKSTGGSTGQPFHFEYNTDSNTRREAVMWRGYGWLGAGLGVKTLQLWGSNIGELSTFKTIKNDLYHRFYNRKILNSFSMSKDNIPDYIDSINKYKASAIVSYVNPIYELSKYAIEHNIRIHSPKTILTGAEPLYEYQREVIQQAFSAPVYNTYGCREFMLMSAECRSAQQLHINSDHLLIETLDQYGKPISGMSGDLVITDLYNYGMPLIRYINGDAATLVNSPCSCGNPFPIMKSVDGRKLDMIRTPTGKSIPGELFPHLFKEFKAIHRFQVRQTELSSIDIIIVENSPIGNNIKKKIINEINKYSKNELTINLLLVDSIPLTISGKHRITISEID